MCRYIHACEIVYVYRCYNYFAKDYISFMTLLQLGYNFHVAYCTISQEKLCVCKTKEVWVTIHICFIFQISMANLGLIF